MSAKLYCMEEEDEEEEGRMHGTQNTGVVVVSEPDP